MHLPNLTFLISIFSHFISLSIPFSKIFNSVSLQPSISLLLKLLFCFVRLEHIQRAAASFVHHTTSVNNLINILGWDRLHNRRLVSRLTMIYKIYYHLVNIQIPQLISPATFIGKHYHQPICAIPLATINSYKFSFYPRSIRLRNQLPSTAVFAASPAAFQAVIEMKLPIGSMML